MITFLRAIVMILCGILLIALFPLAVIICLELSIVGSVSFTLLMFDYILLTFGMFTPECWTTNFWKEILEEEED